MKAMILAAGKGLRMGELTRHTPKPLLTAGSKRLIEYHIMALANADIHDIVINVYYQAEQIMQYLGDGSRYGVNIQYSVETELLGTGGGILKALPLLGDDPFIIISADVWTDYPWLNCHKAITNLAHIVVVDNPPFHPKGDFSLHQGQLSAHGVNKLNYAGFGILHPALFQGITTEKFELAPLLIKAMQQGQVSGEYYSGHWFNVGTANELRQLTRYVSSL